MKKLLIFIFIVGINLLSALSFNVDNRALKYEETLNGIMVLQDDSYYSGVEGEPAIPVLTYYWEIPEFQSISSVVVNPVDIHVKNMNKGLVIQPKQVPLMQENIDTNPEKEYINEDNFPSKWLFNAGNSICGSKNIGYIAIYSAGYNSSKNSLLIPKSFKIDVNLAYNAEMITHRDSKLTRDIQQSLGFVPARTENSGKYLIITDSNHLSQVEDLINHRKKQGLEVIVTTVEDIYSNYTGSDNQEKVRNKIIESYNNDSIDYVTFAGDVDVIPERRVWAFDCNYGIEDENNIPCDMYYSCLDGSWNANGNDKWGEDDDEVDYFPEVIVGRLPIASVDNSAAGDITEKIVSYETGSHEDYSRGLGLCMNLWETSNTVYGQEYIVDQYFPDYINNVILNEGEATPSAVAEQFNQSPNIVMHDGHCFHYIIGLSDFHITETFLDNNMTGNWGGFMYSIGCWANAIDFPSIAESFVSRAGKGVTAFVGNSRYGWGSPAADGFGFSDFFYVEFMKNLFENKITNIAELTSLQKIPFIPYMTGNSVYKWVAYEMNCSGDSYFNLFIDEPKELVPEIMYDGDSIIISVQNSDSEAVSDVVISSDNEVLGCTDSRGYFNFIPEETLTSFTLYHSGYKTKEIDNEISVNALFQEINCPDVILPNQTNTINFKLRKIFTEDIECTIRIENSESNELGSSSFHFGDNNIISQDVDITYPSEENIKIIFTGEGVYTLVSRDITINLGRPNIEVKNCYFDSYPLVNDSSNTLNFTLKNVSKSGLTLSSIDFLSDEFECNEPFAPNLALLPDQESSFTYEIDIPSDISSENIGNLKMLMHLSNENYDNYEQTHEMMFFVGSEAIDEGFETEVSWITGNAWERSNHFSYEGDYSLTCRPESYGTYSVSLPQFKYEKGISVDFDYRYKMPMYGADGFSIYVEYDEISERVIFLGSGGALGGIERDVDDFIFSNWAAYSIDLTERLQYEPIEGTMINIRIEFNYVEDVNVTNNYSEDNELGIYLDNLQVNREISEVGNENNVVEVLPQYSIYPNPSNGKGLVFRSNKEISHNAKITVYNIKGQKIKTLNVENNRKDKKSIYFTLNESNRKYLSSGIYFVRYKDIDKSVVKKIVLLGDK